MSGRHRLRRRRSWWLPALGVVTGVATGSVVYGTVLFSTPAAAPPLPADAQAADAQAADAQAATDAQAAEAQAADDAEPPGLLDRTATVIRVVDGDSFVVDGGATVRVLAADSCEGRTDAGAAGRADAEKVLAGATVTLRREPAGTNDADRDGRLLRYVEVPGVGDLGSYMITRPHTAVYRGFNDASPAYLDRLRALDRDGRRCYDDLPPAGERPQVRYRDCSAAVAAGVGAIYVGDPAYSRELDGNDDGVACE